MLHDFVDENDDDPRPSISQEAMRELYKMRLDNTLCDAVIEMNDQVSFNVHRNILSACSNYFRALFTTKINKGAEKQIKILGIRSAIMEELINYAYLRHCKITDENVHELYVVADYTATFGLMRKCANYMIRRLDAINCVGLMLFGRERFCTKLYEKSRTFLLRYFVEVSHRSEELLELNIQDFYDVINDELLNVKSEETVWECCVKWIDKNPVARAQHVTRLMRAVRLGLLNTGFFMERVKDHKYVVDREDTRQIIIETLTFLYDLDLINTRDAEMETPALAVPRLPHEVIFAIGGWSEGLPQYYIETYDTRADRWIRVLEEDPGGPRAYHGTAVIGFKIYCIGGFDGVEYYNTCRCFDAVTKTWTEIAPMHARRCYVSVAVLDGHIYALGGYDGHNRQNTVERYDPKTNQWSLIAPMNTLRSDADACAMDGKIYITGGFNGQECLNTAEFYDEATGSWTLLPNMTSRRSGVSCVAHKGLIYVIGGFNGLTRLKTGERFDPAENQWSPIREMYNPRSNFGLEIIDEMLFAIGGFNGVVTISHTECYVVETDEWLEATDMGIIRSALTANVVMGLPNVREYIHQDRDKLMEERRLRIMSGDRQSGDLLEPEDSNDSLIEVD